MADFNLMTPQGAAAAEPNMLSVFGNGMATGAQTDFQRQAANTMMEQAVQQGAMGNDNSSIALDQALKNVPLQDLQRQLASATANTQLGTFTSGKQAQVANSDLDTTLAKNQGAQDTVKIQKQLQMGGTAEEISNTLGPGSTIPMADRAIINQKWEQSGLPPLPTDPTEARDMIEKYANFNRNNSARLMATQKQQAELNVSMNRGVNAAQIRATSAEEIAKTKLIAAAQQGPKSLDNYFAGLVSKEAAAGKNPNDPSLQLSDTEKTQLVAFRAGQEAKIPQSAGAAVSGLQGPNGAQPSKAEKALADANAKLAGGTTPPPKTSTYSAQQEAKIQAVMKTNPSASRQDVIDAMTKANKL